MTTPSQQHGARLTDARLAEIRARDQAATPGPWECLQPLQGVLLGAARDDGTINWDDSTSSIGLMVGREDGVAVVSTRVTVLCEDPNRPDVEFDALWSDAQFIAHARSDIPALLAHIQALEAERPWEDGVTYAQLQAVAKYLADENERLAARAKRAEAWAARWKAAAKEQRTLYHEAVERGCRDRDFWMQQDRQAEAALAELRRACHLPMPEGECLSMSGYVCALCLWDADPDDPATHEPSCPLFVAGDAEGEFR